MPSMVHPAAQQWESETPYWRHRFRSSLQRLVSSQLRTGSLYANLRTLVPVITLAVVWFIVVDWHRAGTLQQFLNRSITIRHLILAVGIVSWWNLWLSLSIFDQRAPRRAVLSEIARLCSLSAVCGFFLVIGNLPRKQYALGLLLGELTTLGLVLVSLALLGCFSLGAMVSHHVLRRRTALIVGTGGRSQLLRSRLESQYSAFEFFGCMDDTYCGQDRAQDNYLGSIDGLAELLKTNPIELVLIGLPVKSKYDDIQRVIDICETVGVESHYMQDVFETSRARVEVSHRASHHFAVLRTLVRDPKVHLKRLIDVVGALLILVLVSPILLLAGIAVRLTSPGPVFFVQERYGLNRKRFAMFKFRSMVMDAEKRQAALESKNEADGPVFKLRSDPRVTRVGAFLRKTSIDELPQLFNVFRGEMSLVGPRPLPIRDVSRFEEPWLLRRFSVRPGLTCLWQTTGRSNTQFDDWIKQDLSYIDNWSLSLDFKILLMTIPAVLKGVGAV